MKNSNKKRSVRELSAKAADNPVDCTCYDRCKLSIALVLGPFFSEYLKTVYREFDGDFILPIVLAEIGHHGAARVIHGYSSSPPDEAFLMSEQAWEKMDACNAYSISQTTGIPRETVRRAIQKMLQRGWVEPDEGGGVKLTRACVTHFIDGFNLELMRAFMAAAGQVKILLAEAGCLEGGTESSCLKLRKKRGQPK